MANPEYEDSIPPEEAIMDKGKDYTGFSEQQLDLDAEVSSGKWQDLKKNKGFQKRSRQGKIIAVYHAVSNRLNELVVLYYKFVSSSPHEAAQLLEELKKLRYMQELLLQCLVWEPKGELKESMVPKDIWELIE